MSDSNDNQFLNAVHRKINRKKKRKVLQGITVSIMLTAIVSFQSARIIYNDKMERLWEEVTAYDEAYEWEYIDNVTEEDAFSYLVENMSVDELLEIIQQNPEDMRWINKIKLEG